MDLSGLSDFSFLSRLLDSLDLAISSLARQHPVPQNGSPYSLPRFQKLIRQILQEFKAAIQWSNQDSPQLRGTVPRAFFSGGWSPTRTRRASAVFGLGIVFWRSGAVSGSKSLALPGQ